ncbi:MAG: chromosomal replication initiator protein DnaA [bacterium]
MDIISTWKAVLGELEISVSPVYFPTWIKPLSIASLEKLTDESQLVTILCPSAYHQTMVTQRYQGQLQRSIERITGIKTEIAYIVGKDPAANAPQAPSPLFDEPKSMPKGEGSNNLNPRLTFETYVVGGSNNFAYAAASGAAKSPGTRYNPLFIYGGVGLGKTHLMQAVGHAIYADHPDWNIMYISAETFGSDLIASLQNKKTPAFKKKYRAPNVLLVDDIQFIAGKEYIQEEFFHTFNELYMSQRQVILTSDRPPQEIAKLEERLSSRFMGGLMVDVQSPDFETRVAILTQKCEVLKISIPSEVISLIAERTTSNIRELEGALQGIYTKAVPMGGEITSDIVREYFGAEKERRTQRIRPSSVITKTAQYFSFKPAELTSSSRKAPLTAARHTAMYILYNDLQLPYEQVGRLFGGRDHTTVIHAVEKITEQLKTDPSMAKIIADIKHGL